MHKVARANLKLLVLLIAAALIIAATLLVIIPRSSGENPLTDALEGGDSALTAIGRSYESLTHFTEDDEEQAVDLLNAARASLENSRAKLTSAGRTEDEYVLNMVENYQILAEASEVMAEGVENLLAVSDNMERALDQYGRGEYEEASEEASYCLGILTPLLDDFETWNDSLNGLSYRYIASGHRDQVGQATGQYRSEMEIYAQYVLLLRCLAEGAEFLEVRQQIEEYLRQLQSAIANGDYDTSHELLQEISNLLQSLKDPKYQNATTSASQLDPSLLSGEASKAAQELKMRLKTPEGIEELENFFESLKKYLEALELLKRGDLPKAEQAAEEGLEGLGEGSGEGQGGEPGTGDLELERLFAGLREAFNSLLMRIRGQPEQG